MHTHGEKRLKVQVIVDSPVKLGKPGVCFVNLVSLWTLRNICDKKSLLILGWTVRWDLDTSLSKLICTKSTTVFFVEVKLNLSGVIGQSLPCPDAQAQGLHPLQPSVDLTESLPSLEHFVENSSEEERKLLFLWFPETFSSFISKHLSVSTVKALQMSMAWCCRRKLPAYKKCCLY